MKAENILNSNFTSKNTICYQNISKKKFQNFRSGLDKKFLARVAKALIVVFFRQLSPKYLHFLSFLIPQAQ